MLSTGSKFLFASNHGAQLIEANSSTITFSFYAVPGNASSNSSGEAKLIDCFALHKDKQGKVRNSNCMKAAATSGTRRL